MARYNTWMNGKLYACCARLTDGERKQDMGAFFKSIHGTLNHLLLADRIWMGRFVGPPLMPASLAEELYADFDELSRERTKMDAEIEAYVARLTDADLAVDLRYQSVLYGPRVTPMTAAIMHFFNHQTHHRGQLTTLLMQRGIDPGVTDLLALPDEN
jgi:uncharacterized damage-inducible protein DinB